MRRLLPMLCVLALPAAARDTDWPSPSRDARPLLQWHWPTNLPEQAEQQAQLEQIARAGFGGVEVRPAPAIPDGPEMEFEWLAPGWTERLSEAAKECERLGLSFDFSCMNGSLPGGPWLPPEASAAKLSPVITSTRGGTFELELPEGSIGCLGAWPRNGPAIDLLPMVDPESRMLTWEAPPGDWRIYGTISQQPAASIEAASPGGGGSALDPFSPGAAELWLEFIDQAQHLYDGPFPHARTLDVGLVGESNWSPDFLSAVQHRRGYDLRDYLPELFGDGEIGTIDRVHCDCRETLADLHRESLQTWHRSTNNQGSLSRLRVRGSAGHPLDLPAVADIPGTFIEGAVTEALIPTLHFAASAAHLTTKPLVTATAFSSPVDAATLSPADMKEFVDLLWLSGANQLSLNGLNSAEAGSTAPPSGRFTPLGPASGRWQHLPAFNAYLTRCQSILQSGAPDPDVLLYYPAHDFWTERDGIPDDPVARERWLEPTAFQRCARDFYENGIGFDYVSDRLLKSASIIDGQIIIGGLSYKTLVLPEVRRLPETTAQLLLEFVRRGARIAILGDWPQDVPGVPMPDIRRGTLFTSLQDIPEAGAIEDNDPVELVAKFGVAAEPMSRLGLRLTRRSHADGHHYFIVNRSGRKVDAWVSLATPVKSAVLMDPRFIRRTGIAPTRMNGDNLEIRLVLEANESRILRSFTELDASGPLWREFTPAFTPVAIGGQWKIEFSEGRPELPDAFETPLLGSWTTLADPRAAHFSGTAQYSIEFELPESSSAAWLLDLGAVADTAAVKINGADAGSAFAPPHQFDITRLLKPGTNELLVEVTNLPANQLHPERRPIPSGLLGPVRLIPLDKESAAP